MSVSGCETLLRGFDLHPGADMALANISVTECQFKCPICLDLLRDPVSILCGHTYCMACINGYWDRSEGGCCRCPQCRETFSPRPVPRRNTVLAAVLEKLRLSEAVALEGAPEPYRGGPGEVPCDFCPSESKLRARRSCLVCLASFCEPHALPHRQVGTLRRHKLVDALERLADRLCAQHRLGLEPEGGGEEAVSAGSSAECPVCETDREEDRGAEGQRARRQLRLQDSRKRIQGRIRRVERELDDFQQSLDSFKVSASLVLEDSEALFAEMMLRLDKTKTEVHTILKAKEQVTVGRARRDMEQLEEELAELKEREEEINQLLQAEDEAHFAETVPLLCVPLSTDELSRAVSLRAEAFSEARRALGNLRSRMDEVCREEVDRISHAVDESCAANGECGKGSPKLENFKPQQSQPHSPNHYASRVAPLSFPLSTVSLQPSDQRTRASLLRYCCHLSMNPDTAHPTLLLLQNPQGVHCGEDPQSYPPHPHRFDSMAQVLCREGQVGDASYWEVEWRGGGWVDIGVTYQAIGRKGGGKPCLLGRNKNSWRLRCSHAGYAAWHDNRKTTVAAPPSPRIGVFLERHRGAVSFYSLSDTVLLLHTFDCCFSQPLYPAFRLDLDSTLLICPREGATPK